MVKKIINTQDLPKRIYIKTKNSSNFSIHKSTKIKVNHVQNVS